MFFVVKRLFVVKTHLHPDETLNINFQSSNPRQKCCYSFSRLLSAAAVRTDIFKVKYEKIIFTLILLTFLYFSIFPLLPYLRLLLFLQLPFSLLFVSLRSIYDDQPNAHKRFMEKLDARIRNHDREIEKMCNFHHQGFVDAITELLKVRADAEKLMVRVITGNRTTGQKR